MESTTYIHENLWVFSTVASKCTNPFSSHDSNYYSHDNIFSFLSLLLIIILSSFYIALTLLYWARPGGPAWGKHYYRTSIRRHHQRKQTISYDPIPAGPRGYPLFGSMHLMSSGLAHRRLATAAKQLKAERLMALSLGDTRVVVTSNPDVAKEILNSSVFADRPAKESARILMFNRAIGFAPYGMYWRTLRRIAASHLFSPRQIGCYKVQREEIAAEMLVAVGGCCTGSGREVGVMREILKKASLDNMTRSVLGLKMNEGGGGEELGRLVEKGYEVLGKMNWSDHLEWLGPLDLQLIRFKSSEILPRVNRLVTRIIEEHRTNLEACAARDYSDLWFEENRAFVDILLGLNHYGPADRHDYKLADSDMVAILWEMIFRGTDTVAVLMEWTLARLVLHPGIQSKVHEELDRIVGKSKPLKESHLPSLNYLQAVIKEVLRLHPPGPLLSWARLAITDVTIDGYQVPAGTTAMVNMWAISRDPGIWDDPLNFSPERFLGKDGRPGEFSVFGSDLRLAPFGAGRRSCPGKAFGFQTVSFWIGKLLHGFEWMESDQNPVDLSEVLMLSCGLANPLTVKVCSR